MGYSPALREINPCFPNPWSLADYLTLDERRNRSGKMPSTVILKIIETHLKDVNANNEDTVSGEGLINFKEVVTELKNQKFDGYIN